MLHQVLAVAAALASIGGLAVMACIWVEDRRGKAVTAANAARGGFHRIGDD